MRHAARAVVGHTLIPTPAHSGPLHAALIRGWGETMHQDNAWAIKGWCSDYPAFAFVSFAGRPSASWMAQTAGSRLVTTHHSLPTPDHVVPRTPAVVPVRTLEPSQDSRRHGGFGGQFDGQFELGRDGGARNVWQQAASRRCGTAPLQVDPETSSRDQLASPTTNSKAGEESPETEDDTADDDPVQTKSQGRVVDSVGSEGEGSENPNGLPSQSQRTHRDNGPHSLEHPRVQDMPAGHVGELGPNDSEPLSGDVEAARTNPKSGLYEGPRPPQLVPVSPSRTTIPAVRLAAATSTHQAPNIVLTQPSQPAMRSQPYLPVRNASEADLTDLTRHDSVARSTRSRKSSKASRHATAAPSSLGLIQMQPLVDVEADRSQQRPASVPFPKRPLSQTSRRPRQSSAHVDFDSLRRAPILPPLSDLRGSRFSLPHTPTNTHSPRRHHFPSFITDESSVEIPRFKKRDLNLGIVRKSGMWESAAWVTLWVLSVVNALVGAFFDLNIMYLLAQCATYPLGGGTSSGGLWVFLAVAYSLAWAVSVLVVWLGWEVGFEFWRRWSVRRPAIEPIYFSLPASLNLALWSFSHFSFLLHTRLSPLGTRHALDIVPETAHLLVQLYHGLIPLLARGSVVVIVLISFWNPATAASASASRRDPHFFHSNGQLSAYSKGLLIAFSALVGIRLIVVLTSAIVLWLFSSHPLFGTFSTNAKASPELPRKLVLPQVRDPAHSQMPAKTWRDENELQWAWRDRARARIQDAFELCIVRPSRSRTRLVSWEDKLDEKRVSKQLGLANLSLDMSTPRPLPTKIEKRHRDGWEREPASFKQPAAVDKQLSPRDTFTFSHALETGMCDTGLSPRSAVFDDIQEVGKRCHNGQQPPVYGEVSSQRGSYRNSTDAESAMTVVVPRPWARSTHQRTYSSEPPDSAALTVSTATSPPLITPTLDHPPAQPYYSYGGYSDLDEREPTGLVEPYVFTAITSHRIAGGSHDTLPEGLYDSSLESGETINPKQTKDMDPDDISPEDVMYPRLRPDASFADAVFGRATDDVLFGVPHGSTLFGGASLTPLRSKRGSKSSTASSKRSRKSSRRSSAASEGKASTSYNKFASPSPPPRTRSPPPPLPPLCSSWSAPASRNASFVGIVLDPPRTPPIARSVIPASVPVTPPNLAVPSPQRTSARSPRTPVRPSTGTTPPDSSTSSMTLSQARSTMTVSTINEAELFFSPPASPSPARTLQYHTPSRGGAHHVPGMTATPHTPTAVPGGHHNLSMVVTSHSPPTPSVARTGTTTTANTTSANTPITTVGLRTSLIPLPPEFGVMLGNDASPEPRLRTLSQHNAALLPALVPLSPQLEQAELECQERELLSQAAQYDPPLYPEPLPAPPSPNLRAHVRRRSRSLGDLVRRE